MYQYAANQIGQAVHTLATTEGTVRERLKKAAVEIAFAPVQDLPRAMADDLTKLKAELTDLELDPKGTTSEQFSGYASKLVAFAAQMRRLEYKYEPGTSDDYIPLSS